MLLSQIALVALQSGWTTASAASFSTSNWFFSGAQGHHRRPGDTRAHPRPRWLLGGEVLRRRMTPSSCPPGQLPPG